MTEPQVQPTLQGGGVLPQHLGNMICDSSDLTTLVQPILKSLRGTSLAVQRLGLCTCNAEDAGSIPGGEQRYHMMHSVAKKLKKKEKGCGALD